MRKLSTNFFRLFFLSLAIFANVVSNAQTTIATPVPNPAGLFLPSYVEQGVLVFGVKNTNAHAITITKIANYLPANYEGRFTLWYNRTNVSGAPGAITAANGWYPVTASTPVTHGTTASVADIFSNLRVVISPNTTFRFGLHASVEGPYYGGAASTPEMVAAGGVELHSQASPTSPTYTGTYPSGVTNNPRGFYGSITFLNNAAPVPNNASAFTPVEPMDFCAGNYDVKVKILNNGSNIINNVIVNWELDGALQTPVTYSTPIDVAGSAGGNEAIVTLANVSFASKARTIRVWTSMPNGVADTDPTDDEFQTKLQPKLSGHYVVGSGLPGDFANFSEVVSALHGGICGPVTIEAAPFSGPYNEQFTIPIIRGSSAANRIRFLGNGTTIQFAATTSARHIVKLLGSDFVTLDSFRIVSLAADFGYGILLKNGANNDSIKNCVIDMSATTSTTAASSVGIAASNSNVSPTATGDNTSNLVIYNNEIIGAYRGISLYGNTDGTNAANNRIQKNVVRDFYADGIVFNNQNGGFVENNDVHRTNRAAVTTFAGIELSSGTRNVTVNANRIHDTHTAATTQTGAAYGIFSSSNDAPATMENRITNNAIYNFNSASGTQYGIYNVGSDGGHYYHNTIVLDHQASTAGITRGFYQTTEASNIAVKNNIFYITRGGTGIKYTLYFNTTTSTIASDNNVLYINAAAGTNGIGYYSTGHSSLTDWKLANGGAYDQNSISLDPLFASPASGDFTPQESSINGIGADLGVITDIIGNPRSASPDPGAFEFSVTGLDAGISWVSPVNPATAGVYPVTVNISNTQTINITSLDLSYTDGTTIQSETFNGLNIAPGASQQISFATPYNLNQSVKLFAYINLVNGVADNNRLNDTTSQQFCLPLSGAYTINKFLSTSGRNYASFGEAVAQLVCSGVSGPVTFTVDLGTGPYTEQIVIPAITGASATNRITFFGNGETIESTPVTGNRPIIRLDGADYITLDSLTIKSLATDFGWGVHLTNGANFDSVTRCTIDVSAVTSTTQSNSAGIVASGSATSVTTVGTASHNAIHGNRILGGYQSVILTGTSGGAGNIGNRVTRNLMSDFYSHGIILTNNDSALVAGNNINRMTRVAVTTFNGVELGAGNINSVVDGNFIHDTHNAATTQTGTAYGVYSNANDAPVGSENKVINNLIYNFNSASGTQYGLYNSSSDGVRYYHNTVVLDNDASSGGTTRGFFQTTLASNIQLKNNIIYIARGGNGIKYALYFGTTTSTIVSDTNVLFNSSTAGTNGIGFYGTGFPTLTDWKTANGGAYDQASVEVNPQFVSPGSDYTPTEPTINNIGANLGVATDITGTPRTNTPDPGAYEFSLPGCINPAMAGNATASESIACSGSNFNLELSNNTTGAGQTYTWQSSTDNATWTDVTPAQTISTFSTSQTVTHYYRALVQCSGGTIDTSTVVLVTTPGLVSGTFTINSGVSTGGLNFQSFGDAVNHIKCGINGPVVFNLEAGTFYNEQLIVPEIFGTSPVNTITFNGNNAIISYTSTSSSERASVKLNGADYVTIQNFFINAEGSTATEYGYGVQLVDNADHNTISSNTINATQTPATAASTAFAGIVINSTTATTVIATGNSMCDSNLVAGNTITGGYVGVAIVANSATNTVQANEVKNNTIRDFYLYGIYLNGNDNTLVDSNDISRPSRSSVGNFNGVYFTGVSTNTRVSRNRFHNSFGGSTSSTSGGYGVNSSSSDATLGNENIVSNNMVYEFNGNGIQNGFLNTGSAYIHYYYNSVSLEDQTATAGDTRGFYQTIAASGIVFKNNVIKITRSGTGAKQGLYFNTPGSAITSDYNNIYINASGGTVNAVGNLAGTNYDLLSDWQTASSQDANSLSVDPLFVSTSDLHLMPGTPLDNKGTPIATVTNDIDGDTRDGAFPDMGADELPPAVGVDIYPAELVSPVITNGCYNEDSVIVKIKNNSINPIKFSTNNVTVTVNVTGPANATLSTVINTGTLAPGAELDVTFTSPATVNMSIAGAYQFAITTAVAGDVNPANDQLTVVREKVTLSAGLVSSTPDSYCITGGTPTLSVAGAGGYADIQWQQSTTSGTGFTDLAGATTNPYTVGTAITQTMYYRLAASCGTDTVFSPGFEVVLNNPQITSTTPDTTCGTGSVTLQASGSAGAILNWYENATGGTAIATGPSYTTPVITSTTTYYVAASLGGGGIASTGLLNAISTTGYTLEAGLFFNALTDFTINGVSVYPTGTGAGTVTIALQNTGGTTIQSLIVNLTGTGAPHVKTYVPLNFNVPMGTDYRLVMLTRTGSVTGLVRESGASWGSYPITLPGVLSITAGKCCPADASTSYYYFYDWQVSSGCESARTPVTAVVANASSAAAGTTGTTECANVNVSGSQATATYTDCDVIATINPMGASPVSGMVTACVIIDPTVQIAGTGEPYVQRHYEIVPATNASTATAKITLYFLQSEFDAFNAARGVYPALPVSFSDAAGKANLRVTQFSGTGTLPGNYTGGGTLIDPADTEIIWNAIVGRWEVSFDVTGFSGFYVHTGDVVLPVTGISFRGEKQGSINRLSWTTLTEINNTGFEIQRSADGNSFSKIAFIASKAPGGNSISQQHYGLDDVRPLSGSNYYRLKQSDKDGRATYSNIVLIKGTKADRLVVNNLYPNPVTSHLNLVITAPAKEKIQVVITDMAGRVLHVESRNVVVGDNIINMNVSTLAQGSYFIKAISEDGKENVLRKFVK